MLESLREARKTEASALMQATSKEPPPPPSRGPGPRVEAEGVESVATLL